MSAGLSINGDVLWGSNGTIESLIDAMRGEASEQLGKDAPLTVFLASEHNAFFIGTVVFLDDWIKDRASRAELLEAVNAGAERLLKRGILNDYGKEWLSQILESLRAALSVSDTSDCP